MRMTHRASTGALRKEACSLGNGENNPWQLAVLVAVCHAQQ